MKKFDKATIESHCRLGKKMSMHNYLVKMHNQERAAQDAMLFDEYWHDYMDISLHSIIPSLTNEEISSCIRYNSPNRL